MGMVATLLDVTGPLTLSFSGHDRAKPASLAFDIVPMENGKCQWSKAHPAWKQVAAVGKKLGHSWVGDWKTFIISALRIAWSLLRPV